MPLGSLPLVIGSGLLAELDGFARRQDQDPLEASVPPARLGHRMDGLARLPDLRGKPRIRCELRRVGEPGDIPDLRQKRCASDRPEPREGHEQPSLGHLGEQLVPALRDFLPGGRNGQQERRLLFDELLDVLGSRDRHALTPDGLEQVVEPSQRGFAHALPGSEPSPDVSPSCLLEPRRPAVPRERHQAEIALDPLSLEVRLQGRTDGKQQVMQPVCCPRRLQGELPVV